MAKPKFFASHGKGEVVITAPNPSQVTRISPREALALAREILSVALAALPAEPEKTCRCVARGQACDDPPNCKYGPT